MKMNQYFLTPTLAVDRHCAVKLANLNYNPGSSRADDLGSLYVAPVVRCGWKAPLGLLAVYATTNGDPILLAQIEDGELTWLDEEIESMREVLESAEWIHHGSGEGYSYIVEESL